MYDKVKLGERIFAARKSKGLKQKEVYEKLNLHQSAYSDIENGKRDISVALLYKIADIIGTSIIWLLNEEQIDNKYTDEEMFEIELFKEFILSKRK